MLILWMFLFSFFFLSALLISEMRPHRDLLCEHAWTRNDTQFFQKQKNKVSEKLNLMLKRNLVVLMIMFLPTLFIVTPIMAFTPGLEGVLTTYGQSDGVSWKTLLLFVFFVVGLASAAYLFYAVFSTLFVSFSFHSPFDPHTSPHSPHHHHIEPNVKDLQRDALIVACLVAGSVFFLAFFLKSQSLLHEVNFGEQILILGSLLALSVFVVFLNLVVVAAVFLVVIPTVPVLAMTKTIFRFLGLSTTRQNVSSDVQDLQKLHKSFVLLAQQLKMNGHEQLTVSLRFLVEEMSCLVVAQIQIGMNTSSLPKTEKVLKHDDANGFWAKALSANNLTQCPAFEQHFYETHKNLMKQESIDIERLTLTGHDLMKVKKLLKQYKI